MAKLLIKNAPKITKEDYELLLDNFDNLKLWKEKFPPNSYTFKGFVISNMFDVTDDQSISNIKSTLISEGKRKDKNFMDNFHEIFRSLLNIKELKVKNINHIYFQKNILFTSHLNGKTTIF